MSNAQTRRDKLRDQLKKLNDTYGKNSVEIAAERKVKNVPRIPTGNLRLDYGLGGGVPVGRMNMFAGEKSGAKTTNALRTVANCQRLDMNTYKWLDDLTPEEEKVGIPGQVAWIDVEGVWDEQWAKKLGVDTENLALSSPEYAEQVVDMGDSLIRSGAIDLLVIDSLAAFTPSKEIEASAEDWQQGLAARIINKMLRKWQAAMNESRREHDMPVTIIFINQIRLKIGIMFGNPETKPGGKGQDFFVSTEVSMRPGQFEFQEAKDKTVSPNSAKFKFRVDKNKTGPAKIEGEYEMAVQDHIARRNGIEVRYKAGEVIEDKAIVSGLERYGLLAKSEKKKGKWECMGKMYGTKKEALIEWVYDEKGARKSKQLILDISLGRTAGEIPHDEEIHDEQGTEGTEVQEQG